MTLTIGDTTVTSDRSDCTARQAPSRDGWEVSWLPGQRLDRNTAITAMTLAEAAAGTGLHEGHRLWPHIQGWAAELGLTGTDAIARVSQPPRDLAPQVERIGGQLAPQEEPAGGQPDLEAAD
jgi:hypothetical protein